MIKRLLKLNLFLFDGEEGTEQAPSTEAVETAESGVANQAEELEFVDVVYEDEPSQNTDSPEKAEAKNETKPGSQKAEIPSFDDLISGEYKEAYQKKLEEHLSNRLKNHKKATSKLDMYEPVIDYIKEYTGIDNIEEAFDKLQSETLEEIALSKGFPSVEMYKEFRNLQGAVNNINKKAAPEASNVNAEYVRQQLIEQEEQMQTEFPGFKVAQYLPKFDETGNVIGQPSNESMRFLNNLRNGMMIRPAYLDAYYNRILSETRESAIKNTTTNIKNRGNRPSELAASKGTQATYKLKKDISSMSDSEFRAFKEEKKRLKEKGIDILPI